MASPPGEITLEGWPAGINNVAKDTALPDGFLRDALNVDLDNSGKPRIREGRTKVYAGVQTHSLHKAVCGLVFVEGTTLNSLLPDNTASSIGNLVSGDRVEYEELNDTTFLTNGFEVWTLDAQKNLALNGVERPEGQPLPSFTSAVGALEPGRYLFAVTFVSSRGEESGASLAIDVTTSSRGSVVLNNIPQNSSASHVRIYGTEPGGEVLREFAEVPMGVTSFNITRTVQGRLLETQFMRRLPAGRLIRHFKGRLYVARGDTLWYSEALRYGLCSPADNFISFSEEITVVQPVEDGIYVVADKTYFFSGTNPKEFRQVIVSNYQAIFGTGVRVRGSIFDPEIVGDVAYWYSRAGAMLGLAGGIVRPLMENSVALPSYEEGVTGLREENGIRQAVTALRGSGTAAKFAMGDEFVVTVKRNGIVLP
jgi:hypothetical protein